MATEVILPKLGMTMEEGTIVTWLKKEGDEVEKGEPIFEVTTEKTNIEVEAPESGVLLKIMVPEGESCPISTVVAYIGNRGEKIEVKKGEAEKKTQGNAGETRTVTGKEALNHPKTEGKDASAPKISDITKVVAPPAVRRLARERGIDLNAVRGSGPDGLITREDLEAYQTGSGLETGNDSIKPAGNLRKIIAENMYKFYSEIPMVTLHTEVDAQAMVRFREYILEKITSCRVSYTDILVRTVALALKEFPEVNSSWTKEGIIRRGSVNIGLAMETPEGLMVPVIKNADKRSWEELVTIREKFKERASKSRFAPDDLTGGTFTISNLGAYDIVYFNPIIRAPEGAILGVGAITKKPVVYEDKIEIHPCLGLSLTFDHRLLDGAPAARFLKFVKDLLQNIFSPVFVL